MSKLCCRCKHILRNLESFSQVLTLLFLHVDYKLFMLRNFVLLSTVCLKTSCVGINIELVVNQLKPVM